MIVEKKEVEKIINEEMPDFKCLFLRDSQENLICHYDAYAEEGDVEQLKAILVRLKVECKLERMPF